MKKLILLFGLSCTFITTKAQMQLLPYISTPTVIPQSPTSSDIVKIIVKVTTPNQGIIVDQSTFAVKQNPNQINIRGCYWQGMLPATQDFLDTLVIGQLPAGSYLISHKAFLSSTQQHCTATDSNVVGKTFTVSTTTGLSETGKNAKLFVFPVPAKESLHLVNAFEFTSASIYSADGLLVTEIKLGNDAEINTKHLATGIYFIRFFNADHSQTIKFIKEE